MRTGISYRVVVAGAELRMLVLAPENGGTVGVDLDSGALVRAVHRPAGASAAFDVVSAEIAEQAEPPDVARPEAVELASPPRRVGRLSPRRAEKYLAPLRHPPRLPLLGLSQPAVPYWTLNGDRPSLGLVELESGPVLAWGPDDLECRFDWFGGPLSLAVTDPVLVDQAAAGLRGRPTARATERVVGFRARRLVVALSPPIDGYCHKTVAALLPAR